MEKITINCNGSICTAEAIIGEIDSRTAKDLCYVCTDFEAIYNGNDVTADIYEDIYTGELFAVIR